jgi:hypothetical protein
MAEQDEYTLTHAPPNNTELALLNAFIDQRVAVDLLQHRSRMFDLLGANGLIARSLDEQQFFSRKFPPRYLGHPSLKHHRHFIYVCANHGQRKDGRD